MNNPGVRFPPPLLFLGGFGIGWVIHRWLLGVSITPAVLPDEVRVFLGWALFAGGAVLVAWGMLTFARAHTAIIPNRPASAIVDHGPYRFTRNPMYVGFTLAYMGGALLLNTAWPFAFLPFVLLALSRLVIAREERYLTEAFGASYTEYRSRVRRWL
jgi:protein-S-isoprenylcysteine O-methyltransferase Ste14